MPRRRIDLTALVADMEAIYGPPPAMPRFSPMDELVSCILSQHTADANSLPAFYRLKEAMPDWETIASAPTEQVADLIRKAGLANQKANSIQSALRCIRELTGSYDIGLLAEMPPIEARRWLEALPGVGPKTASIVLCFSFGMDLPPVDTHVFRVAWRLGLFPKEIGEAKAHDALLKVMPKALGYRLHMAFIQHGRSVCRAPKPRCEACEFSEMCAFFRAGPPRQKRDNKKAMGSNEAKPGETEAA